VGAEASASFTGGIRWERSICAQEFLASELRGGSHRSGKRWIIQRVFRLAAEWRSRLPQPETFPSASTFRGGTHKKKRDPGLRDRRRRVVLEIPHATRHLRFELPKASPHNVSTAARFLEGLHPMGIATDSWTISAPSIHRSAYCSCFRSIREIDSRIRHAHRIGSRQQFDHVGDLQMARAWDARPWRRFRNASGCALCADGLHFGQGTFFSAPVAS